MPCKLTDAYLERRLPPESVRQVESHLAECASCRQKVDAWRQVRSELHDFIDDKRFAPNDEDVKRLLDRTAAAEDPGSVIATRFPVLKWGTVAAAIGALLVLATVVRMKTRETVLSPQEMHVQVMFPTGYSPGVENGALTLASSISEGLVAEVGRARVGLLPRSDAQVLRSDGAAVELSLAQGTMGILFTPGERRGELSVLAGAFTIRVVGTKFWVTRNAKDRLEVGVVHGVVEIDRREKLPPLKVRGGNRVSLQEGGTAIMTPILPWNIGCLESWR